MRGQQITIEAILSPLIYRSNALKHSIFANFVLQAEQAKQSLSSPTQPQDLASVHLRHYNAAINYLQTSINNPEYTDANVGADLILAFYNICKGDMENWTVHNRNAAEQIRARGRTLETRPLSLHTKFLFYLYIRTDTVGSNAIGQPANTDHEIAQIVYSGVPISNRMMLPSRMEMELLLGEISIFQYQCSTLLPLGGGWQISPQAEILRRRYDDLVDRLGKWQGLHSDFATFEEAQMGEYPQGAMLPPEMGSPLLCVVSLYNAIC